MSIADSSRGSQLQRLQSWSQRGLRRLRRGARSSLTRSSDQLAEAVTENVASLGSWLADPELLRWSATLTHSAVTLCERAVVVKLAVAVTGAVRKLTTAALPRERKPSPELNGATVRPAFVCDRALVESMRL